MPISNLTIDDASSDITYSPNWATQTALDPADGSFFQNTYHSAQVDGASANLTFTGSAIYLFGTKGPGHANYSIQFDNDIIFYSAVEDDTLYQQPLFGFAFQETGQHFVSLIAHFVEGGQWLDLDYITITVNDTTSGGVSESTTSTSPSVSQTIAPPWLTAGTSSSSSSSSTATTASSGSAASSGNTSTTSHLTLILAIVFGALLVVAAIWGLYACIWRRRARRSSDSSGYRSTRASYASRPSGAGSIHGSGVGVGGEGKYPLAAQFSPRVFGQSHEIVYPPSPASHDKEIASAIESTYNVPHYASGAPVLPPLDGRNSPFSILSQGSMALLLKKPFSPPGSPPKPKPWRKSSAASTQPHAPQPVRPVRPLPQPTLPPYQATLPQPPTQAVSQSQPHQPEPQQEQPQPHIIPPKRSTSLSRPGVFQPTRRAPTPDTIASAASQESRGGRSQKSQKSLGAQSAQSQRPGTAAGATIAGGTVATTTYSLQESPMTFSKPLDTERLVPLVPLRANHASVFSLDSVDEAVAIPKRPRRPGEGLLDWLGNARFLDRDPSEAKQRRKDDGNSSRTDFLKV